MKISELNKLLAKLPFHIVGHDVPSSSIANFFQHLSSHRFIIDNSKFRFLMSGFAKIDTSAISTGQSLTDWPTIPLDSFNYIDFDNQLQDSIVSLYVRCLDVLNDDCEMDFEKEKVNKERATNIFTKYIRKIVNISVEISKNTNLSRIGITFSKRSNTLSFLIPSSFFNDNTFSDYLTLLSSDEGYLDKIGYAQYTIHANRRISRIDEILKVFFSAELKNAREKGELTTNIGEDVIQLVNLDSPKDFNKLINVAIATSIFCKILSSKVYFVLSKANTFFEDEFSLGSIAIGVKNSNVLTNDELSFFTLISNHISSVLSTQYIYETSQENLFRKRRIEQREILKSFFVNVLFAGNENGKDISHGENAIQQIHLDKYNEMISEIGNFGKLGLHSFDKFLKSIFLPGNFIDYCLFNKLHKPYQKNYDKISKHSALLRNSEIAQNIDSTSKEYDDNFDFQLRNNNHNNISLAHSFVNKLSEDASGILVLTDVDFNGIIIYASLAKKVNLENFVERLVNDERSDAGNFSGFIKDNLFDFMVAGDLKIISNPDQEIESLDDLKKLNLDGLHYDFSILENLIVHFEEDDFSNPFCHLKKKPANSNTSNLIYLIEYKS